jgi:hypothetical protein
VASRRTARGDHPADRRPVGIARHGPARTGTFRSDDRALQVCPGARPSRRSGPASASIPR